MRSVFISLLLLVIFFSFYSCSSAPAEVVVAKYGNYKITLDEFNEAYSKSSGTSKSYNNGSNESAKEFLDLYVNFKMKLRDAEVRGYNEDPAVLNEIESYKNQIGKSYIFEKKITEPGVRKLYERRKYEFRISHIMIGFDSLSVEEAENLSLKLIDRINKGESFEELVKQYSTDVRTRDNNGDLYWVTAGDFLPEFEDPIYTTPVGSVYNKPLRSRGGFHLIKVNERQERVPAIRVRHILAETKKDAKTGLPDTASAFAKIQEAYNELKNGADFADVAKKYSDDKTSAEKGGDLGFFERRKTVVEFDSTAFNLKLNEISGIIRTSFGYHIIQLLEKQEYPAYEAEHEKLKNLYNKHFYKLDYNNYVSNLQKEFNYSKNIPGMEYIMSTKDSIKINQDYWESEFRNSVKDVEVFRIGDKIYNFDNLMEKFVGQKNLEDKLLNKMMLDVLCQSYSEEILFNLDAERLDKTDADFAKLMEEYKNGILVFKLHDEEIWAKVQPDDEKLLKYFEENKNNYNWNLRVAFSEIMTKSDSLATIYGAMVKGGVPFEIVAEKYTERKGYNERAGKWNLTEIDKSPLAQKANEILNIGDYTGPFEMNKEWYILRLDKRVEKGPKAFEEAKAEVATNYQEVESKLLEKEYIDRLRKLYKPVMNYDALENISN